MSNEYEMSNEIINSVGPDLSIGGQQDAGKTMGYDHHQYENQSPMPTQHLNMPSNGGSGWDHNEKQMNENNVWQQWGNHHPATPRCCRYYCHYCNTN